MGWYANAQIPCSNAECEKRTNGIIKITPNPNYPTRMCYITFIHEGKTYQLLENNGSEDLYGMIRRSSTNEIHKLFLIVAEQQFGDEFSCDDEELG